MGKRYKAFDYEITDDPDFMNEKYPHVPQLKNYLSAAYMNSGNIEKAREVNHWILVIKDAIHRYEFFRDLADTQKQFVLSPGSWTYARSEIATCVQQIAFHQPERKSEVIQWFREVFSKKCCFEKL